MSECDKHACYRKRCEGPEALLRKKALLHKRGEIMSAWQIRCSRSRFRGWCDYCSVCSSIGMLAISIIVAAMFLSTPAGVLLITCTTGAAFAWLGLSAAPPRCDVSDSTATDRE